NGIFKILPCFVFNKQVLANFSKEFYHWLAVSDNEA
ncbi:MAG: hypothetical protein ACJAZG_002115, partial [Granulosicoccus sp.]